MDIAVLKKLGLAAVVMMLAAITAFAAPPDPGRGMSRPPGDFRPSGPGSFGGSDERDSPGQDSNQRHGKLSADERRELRRQIDEVGQDIYRVKR